MDDAVVRSMVRWPNVPAVYGWLSLDARGRWRLKGELIENQQIAAFIDRNYLADEAGCWHFQNGPQRVFVELALAPFVFSLDGAGALRTHTRGPAGTPERAWLTDEGRLYLRTPVGPGVVDDRDLPVLAEGLSPSDAARATAADEAAVEALLEAPGRLGETPLYLHFGELHREDDGETWIVRVEFLRASEVSRILGFEPRPVDPADAPAVH